MSQHLLAISIGPVQDFIAASRRTNDLYAGSDLLVKIAKCVASVVGAEGELIFPADADDDGPNKILALLKEGVEPGEVSRRAKKVANEFLLTEWKKVIIDGIQEALALDQIEHFLEFYSAWVPSKEETYSKDRENVERLLASRKALRNFEPPISPSGKDHPRPKSPLDPSRDCVLPTENQAITDLCLQNLKKWRLKKTETLDAISCLKRFIGVGMIVPSTSEMALKSHLPNLNKHAKTEMEAIQSILQGKNCSEEWLIDDIFLRENWEVESKELVKDLKNLRSQAIRKLRDEGISAPQPYYAILVADGDKMGKIIGGLDSIDGHKALSTALSAFAKEAQKIICNHHGHPVYTGGDDVLAFLPVNTALECAKKLSVCFAENIEASLKQSGQTEGGTLSVGVAIVHHLENLRLSLENGRSAEKAAKGERNSLAVALHTRGGAPLVVVEKWNKPSDRTEWGIWIEAFRGGLSRGFPYELKELVRDWKGCYENNEKIERFQEEAKRIFKRKKVPQTLALPVLDSYEKWESFADRLVLARFLADFPILETDSNKEKSS